MQIVHLRNFSFKVHLLLSIWLLLKSSESHANPAGFETQHLGALMKSFTSLEKCNLDGLENIIIPVFPQS